MESDWFFFTPNAKNIYKINIYDDGNAVYEQYENEWLVYGEWRGKCALVNRYNPSVKIASISTWKISRL